MSDIKVDSRINISREPDILIVEDNKDLSMGLKNNLEIEGYSVSCAYDGAQGLEMLTQSFPKLIILDLMMPRLDGYGFLKAIDSIENRPMVLILSARDSEVDKVTGLRLGADDFVTKPFGLMELVARVEALIRRRATNELENLSKAKSIKLGDVSIEADSRQISKNGNEVLLTPKEFDLLMELIAKRGQVVSRLDLMGKVWGHMSAVESRTVDTHIGELRKKLESKPAEPRLIKTIRKVGYRIEFDEVEFN
ncbi:MAG: response regulator transcription factor [Kangiellaceae bacterium]|nr:response regulator transcription factor [Kangiellaceae bacterium]MCW9018642.1 response regulator transcription factor [Kangiellaceae bacterium]